MQRDGQDPVSDDLTPRRAKIAALLWRSAGWGLFVVVLLALLGLSVMREGKIWGCW